MKRMLCILLALVLALAAVPALADMPKDIETIPFDELPEPLPDVLFLRQSQSAGQCSSC